MPICCCSVTKVCPILCNPLECSTPSFPVLHYLPEFAQTLSIESPMPANHLICCSFLLLPSIFPSIRVFSNEVALPIRGPKYWRFSISPSNEYSGLISFRIDWFDLPAVKGTLKSLLQHDSLKATILWCSAFFMVLLSLSYMTSTLLSFPELCLCFFAVNLSPFIDKHSSYSHFLTIMSNAYNLLPNFVDFE